MSRTTTNSRGIRLVFRFATLAIVSLLATTSYADPERRRDQFGRDFSYYFYPIAGEIPGLGSAAGLGGSVLNIGDTDADVTGYHLEGDFGAQGIALLDIHLLPKRLIFDGAYNDFQVAPLQYKRGIHSSPDEHIQPKVEGQYVLGQLTSTYDERRYEAFARGLYGKQRVLKVMDEKGNVFAVNDTSWTYYTFFSVGGSVDLTDDRLDPRRGFRAETAIRLPRHTTKYDPEFAAADINLTQYIAAHRWDTLVFNLFGSHSFVTRKGNTDYGTVYQKEQLNCQQYTGADVDACLKTETAHIEEVIAYHKYGAAAQLGGTQRLRSYDNGRYYASKAFFYGVEYRWNLTDERTPFDIFIAKGVRTGVQLAAFWERGSVSDGYRELIEKGRSSYGIGARIVLSGVVIRFDLATGDEGAQSQLFITYPWSMFSVDNPG